MIALASLIAVLPLLASAAPHSKRFTSALIQSGRDGKCMSVVGDAIGDGTLVTSVPCEQASRWNINPGSGSVILASNPGFALDAGSYPGNHGGLKIWTSYPGLYQQTWYLTGDNRIAITGGDQCLDEGDDRLQTYQCTTGNNNQVFYVRDGTGPTPSSSSSMSASSTASSTMSPTPSPSQGTGPYGDIPVGTTYPDPPQGGGRRLHPDGRSDLCLTVQNGYPGVGAAVGISYCVPNDGTYADLQLWDLPSPGADGSDHVKLHSHPDLCLDAGNDPANGSGAKVWTCYDGLLQQEWHYSATNKLSLSNGQCLDTNRDSRPGTQKPYNSLRDVQTWACYEGNTQQTFFELN